MFNINICKALFRIEYLLPENLFSGLLELDPINLKWIFKVEILYFYYYFIVL